MLPKQQKSKKTNTEYKTYGMGNRGITVDIFKELSQ